MRYGLSLVSAPTSEPIGIREAKAQLSFAQDYTKHDQLISGLIVAARQYVESYCGIAIMPQTWQLTLDEWPELFEGILIPKPPLASVTWLRYYAGDGTDTTWSSANYVVSTDRTPGRIKAAYGIAYPVYRIQPDTIRIQYVAGYSSVYAVPETLKRAILLLVSNWFENRTSEVIGAAPASLRHALDSLLLQHMTGDEFASYGGSD